MKTIIIVSATLLLLSIYTYSQELNVGGIIGVEPKIVDSRIVSFGGAIEYRPVKSIVSLNTDPVLLLCCKNAIFSFPLYLKFIIGNKIRFYPNFGGFIRTNSNYGWSAGLSLEYIVKEKLLLFVKGDYNKDYFTIYIPDHFGSSYKYIDRENSAWISIGIKKNILNPLKPTG